MYAGVIASAVQDALRRGLAIAVVQARTDLLTIAKQGGDYFGTLQNATSGRLSLALSAVSSFVRV